LLGEFKTLSFVGDGPLPLSGADRDSIAGESDPRAAGGARGQYNSTMKEFQGFADQLKNAKGISICFHRRGKIRFCARGENTRIE